MATYKNGRHFYAEGRAYQGMTDPYYIGKEYTVHELSSMVNDGSIVGAPLFYEHRYKRGDVGRIIKAYMDHEDPSWLCIGVQVFNDTPYHANVARDLNEKRLTSFSIGYRYAPGERKMLLETSLTDDPVIAGSTIMVTCSKNSSTSDQKKRALPFSMTGATFRQIVLDATTTTSLRGVRQSTSDPVHKQPVRPLH